jgi:hypothetical protein
MSKCWLVVAGGAAVCASLDVYVVIKQQRRVQPVECVLML